MGQFGDKFRKAREKKNISLDDVSNVTKISSRMLQAIEEEKFDQLPGGVFNKGFIRAYAKHVGLNDEDAVNEYLACLRQAQIDAQAVWDPNAGASKKPQVAAHQIAANQAVASKVSRQTMTSDAEEEAFPGKELPHLQLPRIEDIRPPRRIYAQGRKPLPWRPVLIAVLLLFAVAIVWQRYERHARAEGAAVAAASAPRVPMPAAPVSSSPAIPASAPAVHPATPEQKTPAAKSAGTTVNTKSAEVSSKEVSPKSDTEDTRTPAAEPPSSALPASKAGTRFRLVIHADENSWISVTADGQPVSHETLIAPADTSIRANREIVARIGNAAGVSFVWNGEEIQPQGAEAEVKTFVFDENGMHEMAAQTTPQPR